MPRTKVGSFTVDTIVGIFRLGPGYIAIGHRDMPADDAVLVAWRSADLVHWTRFSPPTAGCDATVHMVTRPPSCAAVSSPWATHGASAASAAKPGWRASRPSGTDSPPETPLDLGGSEARARGATDLTEPSLVRIARQLQPLVEPQLRHL